MNLLHALEQEDWDASHLPQERAEIIEAFENGHIIFLPQLAFPLLPHENVFFTSEFSHPKFKNISFNPANGRVRGSKCKEDRYEDLKAMMARYAQCSYNLIKNLFPGYQSEIQIGRTSFRPIEIMGRIPKSYRKDDTRLHVDAFPMSPLQGKRIIRVFTNINPEGKGRVWHVGEPFENIAKIFLPRTAKPWFGRSFWLKTLRLTKSYCTEYDYIMLQIHNQMKADEQYQKTALHQKIQFMPNTSWILFSDSIPHAALSGQYVLEQTFYLPVNAMKYPELSPLATLEKLCGRKLI